MAVWTLLVGLAASAGAPSVAAQGPTQQSAAQRCFEFHKFGAQPVDAAKTADGSTVLAQTRWNWHDAIGCYLTLDQQALDTLRAAPPPQILPDAPTDVSKRCFEHHKFGETPVDVAKTADGQTVLARLSWGYHSTIGCYLVLNNTALATLRATHTDTEQTDTDTETDTDDDTTDTDVTDEATQEELLSVKVFSESEPGVEVGRSFEVAVEFNRAVTGFDADDINVVNGDITRFSGSGSEYKATVTAAALGAVVVLIPRAAALDQDGRGNEPSQPFARTVRTTTSTATAIAIGAFHSCAIAADQTIDCWGNNDYGQTDAPAGQYTAIAAGWHHSCAIAADQTINCWGNNDRGQTDAPDGQYTAIAAGRHHSCAIRADQTIDCWGNNNYYGETDPPAGQYTAIAAADYHSCGIRADQAIDCWGNNWSGQTDAPAGQYTAIATGGYNSCAIAADQTINCWGDNDRGQADAPDGQYTAIATDGYNSCAIAADQTINCWGDKWNGQADAPDGQYTAIAAAYYHSCATAADQTINCWGDNNRSQTDAPAGQLTVITPAGYSLGSNPCGIRVDQTIACWTWDEYGQLDAPPGQFAAVVYGEDFFDTWDREAVMASAVAELNRQEPDHGWTGDVEDCQAGTTSQQYRDSIFQRINWYRQIAGVDPVVENPEFSTPAQHAALIMAAQGDLSHHPPQDWACWTSSGYTGASNSNLYLGRAGVSSIDGYIRDPGANNLAVGHRRWILNPNAMEFGTGDIPRSQEWRVTNALYVVPALWGGSNKTREERGFVAWPPPGYVPPQVNWGRWSFELSDAHPSADFSTASVETSDDFGPVELEIIHRGSSGIVWAMDGDTNSNLLSVEPPSQGPADSDYCYTVAISGVKINNSVQTPYEYAVCILAG